MAEFSFWDKLPDQLLCRNSDKNSDNKIDKERLKDYKTVGLYFSAHWNEPCRQVTTKLIEVYKKVNKMDEDKPKDSNNSNQNSGNNEKLFEVIYIPYDRDRQQFSDYISQMPWLAVDYDDFLKYDAIKEGLQVESIPNLLIFHNENKDGNFKLKNKEARYHIFTESYDNFCQENILDFKK